MCNRILSLKIVILFIILISCKKENKYDLPLIFVGEVTNIDPTGATFNLKITDLSKSKIIDFGFVWSTSPEPMINAEQYSIKSLPETKTYSIPIKTTLVSGLKYYVRAYAKTPDGIVYSKEVSFISLGSEAPKIKSFYPSQGNLNDTIIITGSNFSYIAKNNNILFDTFSAIVFYSSPDTLKVIVPSNLNKSQCKISVSIAGNKTIAVNDFVLIAPIISDFLPQVAIFGSSVTIKGSNFKSNPNIKVLFDNISVNIISLKNDEIVVKVPDLLNVSSCHISVIMNNLVAISNNTFSIPAFTLSDFTPKAAVTGSQIKISGTNFSPIPQNNIVNFGSLQAKVISSSINELTIVLPIQDVVYYDAREISVSVTVLNRKQTFQSNLLINDRWFRHKDSPFNFTGSFYAVVGNKAYLGINQNSGFWEYDPVSDEYNRLANFPGIVNWGGNGFAINNKIYFGTGEGVAFFPIKDFWEYDISLNSWTQKSDFPGQAREWSMTFSINGYGYLGGGIDSYTTSAFDDFWKYNSSTDKWSRIPSFNAKDTGSYYGLADGISVASGNTAYAGLGRSNSGLNQRWFGYNSLTNTWVQLASFPKLRNDKPIAFILNGIPFVKDIYSDFYSYNSSSDSWSHVVTNLKPNDITGIGFSIGNIGYVGIGNALWEYDPSR